MAAHRIAMLAALLGLLVGCAHGRERQGTWVLLVARSGNCRLIVHQSTTDQLETKTVWRGEGCPRAVPPPPDIRVEHPTAP